MFQSKSLFESGMFCIRMTEVFAHYELLNFHKSIIFPTQCELSITILCISINLSVTIQFIRFWQNCNVNLDKINSHVIIRFLKEYVSDHKFVLC